METEQDNKNIVLHEEKKKSKSKLMHMSHQ